MADALYNTFLEELNALEKFRMSYSGVHSSEILGRDDPDVKRLIEAMAFFNARTKTFSLQNIVKTRCRMFEQYFSYLLNPLPSMAILQAYSTGRFTEQFVLPKDSEIIVTPAQGESAYFRTLSDLHLLPITLKKAELVLGDKQGYRILIHFHTPYPRNDSIDRLSIYLNYLNNYDASLKFLYALRKHLKKCWFFFDEKITESSLGIPSDVFFGTCTDSNTTNNGDFSHPLQKIRNFFHFPQQELYFHCILPPLPRNWTRFTVALDLDSDWPKTFSIHRDIFQIFTVPMMNIKQGMAQPILCDGTKEVYPILYPDPKKRFTPHSILGVYTIEKTGLVPLCPGILKGGNGSYEIEHTQQMNAMNVLLHLPEAFTNPKKIAIEALWFQPTLSEKFSQISQVLPSNRKIEGISWDILGEVRLHQENPLSRDGEGLLEFLSLQKKPIFDLQEIRFLIKSLGCLHYSRFQTIPSFLDKADVKIVPQSKKIGGIKYIYEIRLKEFDVGYRPMIELFLKQLLILLQTCSADSSVALKVQITPQEIIELE